MPSGSLTRRELLGRGARTALLAARTGGLGALTACSSTPRADQDLRRLARSVSGRVVAPRQPGYADAKLLFNPQFDGARPLAIVFCRTPEDVATTVGFARKHEIVPAARSGRHSFGGYSAPTDGIVVDVSEMRGIQVAPDRESVTVGPGALNVDLYSTLGPQGLVVPTGTCPTVGVAGLTLGGGFGYSSRAFGLTADNLLDLELVLASGERVTCSPTQEPDLFWACRGGGGGNFGIVTSFRFKVHFIAEVATYDLTWDWRDATAVIEAWQQWAPETPDELYSTCALSRSGGPQPQGPSITSAGQYFGSATRLAELIEPLEAAARPVSRHVARTSFVEAQRKWAGDDCAPDECSRQAANPYKVKSAFFDRSIPEDGIATAIEEMERWPGSAASSPSVGLELNSWGGAINRVPASDTAFVHRDARFLAIYGSAWSQQDGDAAIAANREWLEGFAARMDPYSSGFAYQNLIDPTLEDWQRAYYGSNHPRLTEVKQTYDPDDVFRFPQGIGS
ncbi:MAG TPA: FAD-binding oxidoreductase [Candidatus Binatia bacterium]|nr:FAD-binding oxidoreductase [Candidatus Binatia bacterium]